MSQTIKAKFCGKSKELFPTLKKTKGLVLLSIKDNLFCSREYLNAILIHAVMNYGFTTFLVVDEPHWNNLKAEDHHEAETKILKEKAICIGDEYLLNNLEYFLEFFGKDNDILKENLANKNLSEQLDIINANAIKHKLPFEIIRWANWINLSELFSKEAKKMQALCESNISLKTAFESSAENFAKRFIAKNENEKYEIIFTNAKSYLMEEWLGIVIIATKLNYNFVIYPGSVTSAFKATREFFVNKNSYPDTCNLLVNYLHVKFSKVRDFSKNNTSLTQDLDLRDVTEGAVTAFLKIHQGDNESKIELIAKFIGEIMNYRKSSHVTTED